MNGTKQRKERNMDFVSRHFNGRNVAILGLLIFAFFMVTVSQGCSTFYSAKDYAVTNLGAFANAGSTCVPFRDKPDEYTVSFGWTFRRDPVSGTYTEQSITYVTVGLICKDYTDDEGNPLPAPKISHTTVTCDVTKTPEEGPCGNLVEWGIIDRIKTMTPPKPVPSEPSEDPELIGMSCEEKGDVVTCVPIRA